MLNFLHYNVNVNIITCQICAFYDYYVQGLWLYNYYYYCVQGYGFTTKTIQVILYPTMIIIKFPIETFV